MVKLRHPAALALLWAAAASAQEPPPAEPAPVAASATLHLRVTGLRSQKGEVRLCLFTAADAFPKCGKGDSVRKLYVSAVGDVRIDVPDLAPGLYAVAAIHDENVNRRLDKRLGIPSEGVGFSNNPRLSFGAPSFRAAHVDARGGDTDIEVKMKYFL